VSRCLTLYPELRQQYLSVSEADDAIRKVFYTQLDDAPLRLLDTTSGLLCDREAQICAFKLNTEYKELLSLIVKHADIRTKEVVTLYFRCVILSHMSRGKEPLLHDIKDKVVYELNPVDGIVKLQLFCKKAKYAQTASAGVPGSVRRHHSEECPRFECCCKVDFGRKLKYCR